jgi:hypothetical protein
MKYFVSIIFCITAFSICFAQTVKKPVATKTASTSPVNIPLTLKPYTKVWVYIGCYYGKGKTLTDSVFLDENSKGVFKPAKK